MCMLSDRMEHGKVTWKRSSQCKNDLAVYKSVCKPGCVYKFFCKRDTEYHIVYARPTKGRIPLDELVGN